MKGDDEDDQNSQEDEGQEGGAENNEDGTKGMRKSERKMYSPYRFSGKSYSFDINQEKLIMDNLREWAYNYFTRNTVIH